MSFITPCSLEMKLPIWMSVLVFAQVERDDDP